MKMGKAQFSPAPGAVPDDRMHSPPGAESDTQCAYEQKRIQMWLKQVRFQKAAFGGVKEADVWKKIGELNAMYEALLTAERVRYDTLLAERVETAAQQLARQMYYQTMGTLEREKAGDGRYD